MVARDCLGEPDVSGSCPAVSPFAGALRMSPRRGGINGRFINALFWCIHCHGVYVFDDSDLVSEIYLARWSKKTVDGVLKMVYPVLFS